MHGRATIWVTSVMLVLVAAPSQHSYALNLTDENQAAPQDAPQEKELFDAGRLVSMHCRFLAAIVGRNWLLVNAVEHFV
jgi:hypothetical protein